MNRIRILGRLSPSFRASSPPLQTGHYHVGQQQVNRPVPTCRQGEGLLTTARLDHFVTGILKNPAQRSPDA